MLDVKGTTSAYSEDVKPFQPPKPEGRGRPPAARYHEDPSSLKELALAAGKKAAQKGTRGKMNSRFIALGVRPANIELRRVAHKAGEELPVRWLICEWPSKESEPTKYWLSNLPADTPLKQLVRLAKMRATSDDGLLSVPGLGLLRARVACFLAECLGRDANFLQCIEAATLAHDRIRLRAGPHRASASATFRWPGTWAGRSHFA